MMTYKVKLLTKPQGGRWAPYFRDFVSEGEAAREGWSINLDRGDQGKAPLDWVVAVGLEKDIRFAVAFAYDELGFLVNIEGDDDRPISHWEITRSRDSDPDEACDRWEGWQRECQDALADEAEWRHRMGCDKPERMAYSVGGDA